MMEFTNLTMQLQSANWGWSIAFFLWFIGLSGMGMFLNGWVREKALVYLCAVASILGTLLVVSHLARLTNLPAAAFYALTSGSFNFGSWMMIGMVLLTLQCCATVFYALSLAGVFKSCEDFVLSNFFNHITMALGVIVTIYSGFLLTQAVGVTLWNTALIPLLWIMSGMASAISSIELMMVSGKIPAHKVHWSRRTAQWSEAAELFTIYAFVHVALSSSSAAARVGAESLIDGPYSMMFWLGVILFGSIVPLPINLITRKHVALAISAVLGLAGALMLRASVLFAGYYEPILF